MLRVSVRVSAKPAFSFEKAIVVIRTSLILTIPATFILTACGQTATEPIALAEGSWSVDPATSSLSYVTVKSGEIAEANRSGLTGNVAADGTANVEIDLSTVNTVVDIRNERMRDIFFDLATHPTATITAKFDPQRSQRLA